MNAREIEIVENFVATIIDADGLEATLANGERDAVSYGLSMLARRALGFRIRRHFAGAERSGR